MAEWLKRGADAETRATTDRQVRDTVEGILADIANRQELMQSMMPEGLIESLSAEQRRDLIAYLMHPTQVPLP